MNQINPQDVDDALASPELIKQLMDEMVSSRRFAEKVHRSLLPSPVNHPQINVDVKHVPIGAISGSYCQVRFPDPTSCYVTMCDVRGQGLVPALLATRVSTEVRHLILERLRPLAIVRTLNDFIYQHFHDAGISLSFVAAQIDLIHQTLSYSSAGHTGLFLGRRLDGFVQPLECQNSLIGVNENCLSEEPENTHDLFSCDRLLFCTRGLFQAMDSSGRELGQEGFQELASEVLYRSGTNDLADQILERIELFRDGPPQDDTMLIIAELQ